MAAPAPVRPPTDRYNSVEDYHNHYSNQNSNDTLGPGDHHPEKRGIDPGRHADMTQLNDDLELLRAEQLISNQEHDLELQRSRSRNRTHNPVPEDAFNQIDSPYGLERKKNEDAALYKLWSFLKKFPRFIRYIAYMLPVALLLLLPVLLGAFAVDNRRHAVGGNGGVNLMWFGIWLEIVWCSLWVSRMLTNLLPPMMQTACKIGGSTNPKKWKDVGSQLELHAAMFLWFLAILVSFKPTTAQKRVAPIGGDEKADSQNWIDIVYKVIIALFVLFTLNFIEKIIIQWIATSFHQRTYATRIENNKGDIRQLVQLFEHAKTKLEDTESFLKGENSRVSGTQTPMRILHNNARNVLGKVGYVAGKVGNDLIGRKVSENQPRKVVTELLRSTASAFTLARLIYRSLVRPDRDTVHMEDIREVFTTDEEADAAFMVFDKDLNGDISVQEFETVCNEIHLEKKAIAASLKDLDSVIQKLDKVFLFIIVIISIIVFISILSGSAAAGLASASTSVLGLAWVLQATAQEFLQSIIFVFVKHPFDVGDRVTIYGSTGDKMTGDDYYVTEISLLYTEFKKMQGHIVQAPNSVLNNLFILNQRRSNGLADPVPLVMRFGTPVEKIDELKDRMRNFCLENKRDYQSTIISEMVSIDQLRSCTMNIIFFHKTNFQNELLRLNRHNRFVTELMAQMLEVGIQAPMRIEPGGSRDTPMYWSSMPAPPAYAHDQDGEHHSGGDGHSKPSSVPLRRGSVLRTHNAPREMTIMEEEAALTSFGDVFESRRDQALARRMVSIREKERAEKASEGAESEPRASTTSAAVHRSSTESHRARLFSRPRRDTTTTRHEDEMV
ncbi:MS ion channel protein 1 [Cordyceps fumosorosea ARSEF 2679]|uniref:Mechanosensitive ion channel protein n=1 Tax=Cordyceps fumosorosea (strain ARSEF 2679) TaxID=1081104 RepID=A0A162LJN6_CORFA|nr:MS ion channel protein 1 [Cordyceps fumosorosea ARSEF 2679]OAA71504.1 MS ion channel protein 1 [Cordyceps fumosorosea ARSEF 2679]